MGEKNMNKVILIGNLTKDPELSTTNSGINYCRFTLAVPKRFVQSGERDAEFINIVVWRVQADNCHKYLKKGSKACVVGSLQTRSYDAQDGTKRYVTEVVAEEVEFLSTKNSADTTGNFDDANKASDSGDAELQPIEDDTLPF
jgi:single-strand DNA-binding protein